MMCEIREVKLDKDCNFRPVGKRTRYYATTDRNLEVGGVYKFFGNRYHRVEKIYGGT